MESQQFENNLQLVTLHPLSLTEVARGLTSDQKFSFLERIGHAGLESFDDIPAGSAYLLAKLSEMPTGLALAILAEAKDYHDDDANFPADAWDTIVEVLAEHPLEYSTVDEYEAAMAKGGSTPKVVSQLEATFSGTAPDEKNINGAFLEKVEQELGEFIEDWEFRAKVEAVLIHHHSPYPQVRSVTEPFDDPTIPVETFRSYLLLFIWVIISSGVNEFFSHRMPSIGIGSSVVQMFLYPCGKFLEYVLPTRVFTIRGKRFSFNPGPWSFKEQMWTSVCILTAAGTTYALYNLYTMKMPMFYNLEWAGRFGYQVLLTLLTQFMGYGLVGICRKALVYPPRAIWQQLLPTVALNRALLSPEKRENIHGWRILRYNFFWIAFGGMFLYFWIPNYLFQNLLWFNWMTWIAPDNFNLTVVTGSYFGLGLNPISTFDLNMFGNSPFVTPWSVMVTMFVGQALGFIIIIALYYSNYKWTAYLPPNANSLYANTGKKYKVLKVVNKNMLLDEAKYQAYSPPYYSAANLLVYGSTFALFPFLFCYMLYVEWRGIKSLFILLYKTVRNTKRSNFTDFKDPMLRMMAKYPEVPDWWFLVILIILIVLAILCVELYPTETPVWGIFFALVFNFIFLIPLGLLLATTTYGFGLNVLVELLVGYMIPGNGLALMFIKALGYNIDGQADNYISSQKTAHYTQVPPVPLFRGQLISTVVQCFVSLGVINWLWANIEGICTPDQKQHFYCNGTITFYSSSVIWGVIGPKRVFGGLYPVLKYCFLIGFLLFFPAAAFHHWGPKKWTRYFQPLLVLGGMLSFAPSNLLSSFPSLYSTYAFMVVIRKRYSAWWSKYNYVLLLGLNAGIALLGIIIFFAVQYHPKDISWWGNNAYLAGIDFYGGQLLRLDVADLPNGYFGPEIGHFP